jgi:hypothetical protein
MPSGGVKLTYFAYPSPARKKTALIRHRGRWCIPHGATPSAHIFKLPLGLMGNLRAGMRHSVENEWLYMEIMRELGMPVAHVELREAHPYEVRATVVPARGFIRQRQVGDVQGRRPVT